MGETKWRRRDDWIGSQVEDRYVMINLDSGEYLALNETATRIWDLLDEPRDPGQIVDRLVEHYAIDRAACRQSVDALLDSMHAKKIAEPVD